MNKVVILKEFLSETIAKAHTTKIFNKQRRFMCYSAVSKALGYTNRQRLPHSIENAIKMEFPDENGTYVNFKEV